MNKVENRSRAQKVEERAKMEEEKQLSQDLAKMALEEHWAKMVQRDDNGQTRERRCDQDHQGTSNLDQFGDDRGQIRERRCDEDYQWASNLDQFGDDRGQIRERRCHENYMKTPILDQFKEDSKVSQRTCRPLTSARVESELEEAAVRAYAPRWSSRVSPHGGVFTQQQLKAQESLASKCNFVENPIVNIKEGPYIAATNDVDSWIDSLEMKKGEKPISSGVNQDVLITYL